MGQGDIPASPGGPLKRWREKHQLERLAEKSERKVGPPTTAAAAHVRVLEDRAASEGRGIEEPDSGAHTEPLLESHPGGFHVHPVPIDEPFSEA
jgi:hypothetical protein